MLITAKKIHNGINWLPEGACLSIAADGRVEDILYPPHTGQAIVYDGIITPGFVNAHCHLELSHLKGVIPEHTGLMGFLEKIPFIRNDYSEQTKYEARKQALQSMIDGGIVAVGDISNATDTIDVKESSPIHFHTFVESFGFNGMTADVAFNQALSVAENYEALSRSPKAQSRLNYSITPHAPYSVSQALFAKIDAYKDASLLSIHNQECEDEDLFFKHKTGGVNNLLQTFKIDASSFEPSGKSSLQTYMEYLNPAHQYLFVHNTYTQNEDINYIKAKQIKHFWCLCPGANLYIENTMPNVMRLKHSNVDICLGTDSLTSNHQLSILHEMCLLKHHNPDLAWEDLIRYATWNGASALRMNDIIGSIEAGKKPGILLLSNIDNLNDLTVKRLF